MTASAAQSGRRFVAAVLALALAQALALALALALTAALALAGPAGAATPGHGHAHAAKVVALVSAGSQPTGGRAHQAHAVAPAAVPQPAVARTAGTGSSSSIARKITGHSTRTRGPPGHALN
jgi:hypothetical protein